jgi:hypothetical protein
MPQEPTIDADDFIEMLQTAQEENKLSTMRSGNVVTLPAEGEVWMTGDIHDHRNNFKKLFAAADLKNHPDRHVIIHELIHGDHVDAAGAEDSWRMLYDAASKKCAFPNQVHFLMANHDLAQVFGEGISKGGTDVCEAFRKGLKRDFGQRYHFVESAISEFLLSLPVAIRAPNGLWFSHSLPKDSDVAKFDYSIFERELNGEDFKRKTGAAYQLIWGRGVTDAGVDQFAEKMGVKLIVTGHESQESGFLVNNDKHLIVASDHNRGVFVPISLSDEPTMEKVQSRIKRFVAVELPE